MEKQVYLLKKNVRKKEGKKRAAHIFALLKKLSATPTSLLLIKRNGTPPSLPIFGVALKRVPLFNILQLLVSHKYTQYCLIQRVPPIWGHTATQFCNF